MVKIIDINEEIKMIDLNGIDHSSFFIQGDEKNILIESGNPEETDFLFKGIDKLGLDVSDIDYFLATHIHLDHVGSAGHLANKNNKLEVFIHEIGAKHLINPEKLNASAKRAYKERFPSIGPLIPVPANQVHSLRNEDIIELGGNNLKVYFTPGHAKHHLIVLEEKNNMIFVGDAMGTNYPGVSHYITTPPPDYNMEQALNSIDLIKKLNPTLLIYTHFGPLHPTTNPNIYNEIKNKHKFWVKSIREFLIENPNISKDAILKKMITKTSIFNNLSQKTLKDYEQVTINSFTLNIEGVTRYLKKNSMI